MIAIRNAAKLFVLSHLYLPPRLTATRGTTVARARSSSLSSGLDADPFCLQVQRSGPPGLSKGRYGDAFDVSGVTESVF